MRGPGISQNRVLLDADGAVRAIASIGEPTVQSNQSGTEPQAKSSTQGLDLASALNQNLDLRDHIFDAPPYIAVPGGESPPTTPMKALARP